MQTLNPCDDKGCGGIPFVAPYYNELRGHYEDMYIVRCMVCGNVGTLEYTEDEALHEWNKRNKSYIAG